MKKLLFVCSFGFMACAGNDVKTSTSVSTDSTEVTIDSVFIVEDSTMLDTINFDPGCDTTSVQL